MCYFQEELMWKSWCIRSRPKLPHRSTRLSYYVCHVVNDVMCRHRLMSLELYRPEPSEWSRQQLRWMEEVDWRLCIDRFEGWRSPGHAKTLRTFEDPPAWWGHLKNKHNTYIISILMSHDRHTHDVIQKPVRRAPNFVMSCHDTKQAMNELTFYNSHIL